ncbi:MAG: GPW/gp25 family protein [Flavobacteriales bacterium]|nr:GPW/gp25 family protein [Flavobacteriales bacterium]
MDTAKSFLGRGWKFPPEFDRHSGTTSMLEAESDIQSSLHILLSTRLGERVMLPNYGCNIDHLVFESMDLTMITYLRDLVENAILYNEPRIKLEKVSIDASTQEEGLLSIEISYTIHGTNTRSNYVYPFYINEGNNLTR